MDVYRIHQDLSRIGFDSSLDTHVGLFGDLWLPTSVPNLELGLSGRYGIATGNIFVL